MIFYIIFVILFQRKKLQQIKDILSEQNKVYYNKIGLNFVYENLNGNRRGGKIRIEINNSIIQQNQQTPYQIPIQVYPQQLQQQQQQGAMFIQPQYINGVNSQYIPMMNIQGNNQ